MRSSSRRWPLALASLPLLALACLYAASVGQVLSAARQPLPGDVPPTAQVLVLGRRLDHGRLTPDFRARLDRARQLLARNPGRSMVISGGQAVAGITEAARGALALAQEGTAFPGRLRLEEAATNTFDNLAFSARMAVQGQPVAVVTNRYHLARVARIARQLGLDIRLVPAEEAWVWSWANLQALAAEAACHAALTLGWRPPGYRA